MIKPSLIERTDVSSEGEVRVAPVPSKGIFRIRMAASSTVAASMKAYTNAFLPLQWALVGGTTYKCVMPECHAVFQDGTKLTENPGAFAALGADEWDWDTDSLYVNIGADPTGEFIEAAFIDLDHQLGMAIYILGGGLDWTYFDSGLVVVAVTTAGAADWIVEVVPHVERFES